MYRIIDYMLGDELVPRKYPWAANATTRPRVGLMLGLCRRRWTSNEPALGYCRSVFAVSDVGPKLFVMLCRRRTYSL